MAVGWSHINTSGRRLVIHVTVLSFPLSFAITVIIPGLVNAPSVLPARVVHTLVPIVHLAVGAGGASDTLASVARGGGHTGPSIVAVVLPADVISSEVALRPGVSIPAGAVVA